MRVPYVETWIEVAGLFFLVIGSVLMIPTHGAIGAAYVVLGQRVLAFVALIWIGGSHLRRWNPEPTAAAAREGADEVAT